MIFKHDQRLMQRDRKSSEAVSDEQGGTIINANLRMVWKSCTVDSEFFDSVSPAVVRISWYRQLEYGLANFISTC